MKIMVELIEHKELETFSTWHGACLHMFAEHSHFCGTIPPDEENTGVVP
jgi:hypothetical protein